MKTQSVVRVERIAPVVDPTTGSVRVFINVEEGQRLLRPGQFVKAQVEVARHENTIVLPKEAVVYEDGAPIAYMVTDAPKRSPWWRKRRGCRWMIVQEND